MSGTGRVFNYFKFQEINHFKLKIEKLFGFFVIQKPTLMKGKEYKFELLQL